MQQGCREWRAHCEVEEDTGKVNFKIVFPIVAASHVYMRLVWNIVIHMVGSRRHSNACSQVCVHASATHQLPQFINGACGLQGRRAGICLQVSRTRSLPVAFLLACAIAKKVAKSPLSMLKPTGLYSITPSPFSACAAVFVEASRRLLF
jgi:hypothetical protein